MVSAQSTLGIATITLSLGALSAVACGSDEAAPSSPAADAAAVPRDAGFEAASPPRIAPPFDVAAALAEASPAFLAFPEVADKTGCASFRGSLAKLKLEEGTLDVPLVHGVPNTPMLKVHYVGQWTGRAAMAPAIFFNGGPGSASWAAPDHLFIGNALVTKLTAANAPWVMLDQRGNGCSTGYPTVLPANASEASLFYGFSSAQILQDAEVLRRELFHDQKWVAVGQSYGSLLVQQYMQLFPTSLVAVHAQGFGILADRTKFRGAYQDWMVSLVDDFWLAHPELASKRDAMYAKYEAAVAAECPTDGKSCALGLFPDGLLTPKNLIDSPTAMIDFADQVIAGTAPASRPWKTFPTSYEYNVTAKNAGPIAVARIDYSPPIIDPADIYGCAPGQNASFAKYSVRQLAGMKISHQVAQCARTRPTELALMQQLGTLSTGPTLEGLVAAIASHPEVKFNLYQGIYDDLAPPTYVIDEVARIKALPNATFKTLSGNHGAYQLPEFAELVLASMQ